MKEIIYNSYQEKRNPPKNLMSEDLDLFKHEFSKNIPNAYLLKRKNITYFNSIIISATKLTYFKKYSFFGDKTTIERFKRIIKSWLTSDKNKIIIEKGIWFTDHKSHVYFHWLMDSLQRAEISFEYQKEYPLLLPEELYEKPFVVESLDHLGLNYILLKKNQIYKIKKIIITSKTAETGNYNKNILSNLIDRFHENINLQSLRPEKNIFIYRKKEVGRTIGNFENIKKILDKYNFEVVEFEDLSFKEKIKLLGKCKNLIGIFGSGLTNMIFMKKNMNVIEIRQLNDKHNNAFYSLASATGLNYYYLFFEFKKNGLEINPENFEYLISGLT